MNSIARGLAAVRIDTTETRLSFKSFGVGKGAGSNRRNGPTGALHDWFLTPFRDVGIRGTVPSLAVVRGERQADSHGCLTGVLRVMELADCRYDIE